MKYCRFINKVIDKAILGYNIEFFDDSGNSYTKFVNKGDLQTLSDCIVVNAYVRKNNSVSKSVVPSVHQKEGIEINSDGTLSDGSRRFVKLYHGSKSHNLVPKYSIGRSTRDFGKGLYLYPSYDIAREWANSDRYNLIDISNRHTIGRNSIFVHEYNLYIDDLKVFDFRKAGVLAWVAYVLSHRNAVSSFRHENLSRLFIDKYIPNVKGCDALIGWRADASFFYLIRKFVLDEIGVDSLSDILLRGNVDLQVVLRSKKAFGALESVKVREVPRRRSYEEYNNRDQSIRNIIDARSKECIDASSKNVFSNLVREELMSQNEAL